LSFFHVPSSDRFISFPYITASPTLNKKIKYNEDEVWNEFERIGEEAERSKWTAGQSLFYQIPLFANAEIFLDEEYQNYIREYMMVKRFNIPAAPSLDEADWHRMKYFEFIEEEMNACMKRDQEKKK